MEKEFKNKIILITGGTGTIGSEIVKELLKYKPKQIRVLSRDENKQYHLLEKLKYPDNLRLFIGDIRDKERLDLAFEDVDIVIHTAALKHVSLCEYNPFEAVKTNIYGSQNIISCSIKHGVKKVIGISTDKAANPTSIMGTSKLMMEKLFINANYYVGKKPTVFSCVRFGNVAWANGSVLPLWKKQASDEGRLKVTNNKMSRFLMSKKQAAELVLKAVQLTQQGEVFILKMPAIKLADLAKLFILKYYPDKKIKLEIIGNRLGEKIHESLFDGNDKEKKILEDNEMFIILPNFEISRLVKVKPKKAAYLGFKAARRANINKYSSSLNCLNTRKIKEVI
ncbi:MAG: SDR family NAD(P)-dependent oxidoreductase [Patescibacteria group bacterium]